MKTYVIEFRGEIEVEADSEEEALDNCIIPLEADYYDVVDCYDENGEEVDW